MKTDWEIHLKIQDKKAKAKNQKSIIFEATIPCLTETILPTIVAVVTEGSDALERYKLVQSSLKSNL